MKIPFHVPRAFPCAYDMHGEMHYARPVHAKSREMH